MLEFPHLSCYYKQAVERRQRQLGGIAQLGERLNGIQEVSGSIPIISTILRDTEKALKRKFQGFFVCFMNFLIVIGYIVAKAAV